MNKKALALVIVLSLLMTLTGVPFGTSVIAERLQILQTVTILQDAEVRQANPNVNFGSGLSLPVQSHDGSARSTYLSFDLTGYDASSIETVELILYATYASPEPFARTHRVVRITGPWSEDTLTWDTQPTNTSLNSITMDVTKDYQNKYIAYDVTSMVKDALGSGSTFSCVIVDANADSPTMEYISYRSKEGGSESPKLEIHTSQTQYTLTVSHTVGGVTNPPTGAYDFNEGTSVTVTATPDNGYSFDKWIIDGSGQSADNPISITMTSNRAVHAEFVMDAPPQKFGLIISVTPSEGGSTSPAPGIYEYDEGTQVVVSATPNAGYTFRGWIIDDVPSGEVNPYTITMDKAHEIVAGFLEEASPPKYELVITASSGGTTNPTTGTYQFDSGTIVTVLATAGISYIFRHWLVDGVTDIANPIQVTMNKNISLHAVFEIPPPERYSLTITATAGGTTDPLPGQYEYDAGTTVIVEAVPNTGYVFIGWTVNDIPQSGNPISFPILANIRLHAIFELGSQPPEVFSLTVSAEEGGTTIPQPGVYTYNASTQVQLTAVPDDGYLFLRWKINQFVTSDQTVDIVMDQNIEAIAEFYPEGTTPPDDKHKLLFLGFPLFTLGATVEAQLIVVLLALALNLGISYGAVRVLMKGRKPES